MKKINFLSFLAILTLFVGCKKDGEDVASTGNVAAPNATNFQNLRKAALEELTKTNEFTVDGTGDIEFTSEKGVKVSIPEYCLTINGQTVSGTVKVEFVELFDTAELLTTNIATMGRDLTDGNVKFLVTGGAFYVNVTQNGKAVDEISYCAYKLEVPAKLTGGVDQDMILWYGNFDENGNLIWDEASAEINPEFPIDPETGEPIGEPYVPIYIEDEKYITFVHKFGWTNIDKLYKDRETTMASVKVPDEYNGTNSMVYYTYKDLFGLQKDWLSYDKDTKSYKPYLIVGLDVHIIFASESNGKWAYAIKSVTVTKDLQVEFLKSELKEATQAELEAEINKLR